MTDELHDVMAEFWEGLRQTDRRASCPACGAADLEVREAIGASGRWSYVRHCDDVRLLHPRPDGAQFDVGETVRIAAGCLDDYDERTGMVAEDTPLGYVVTFGGDERFYWPDQLRRVGD